jgi:dienelactone hydrolase
MEKEGYETVEAAAWNINLGGETSLVPNDLVRILDMIGEIPPGMVRVSGTQTSLGDLGDFYIDRYEVTNKQYKEFISRGGYRKQEYWEHDFTKDGTKLTWEEAMAEFVDQTNRPGPANWEGGDYPSGQDEHPVSGISWYEAAAYATSLGKCLPTGSHWGLARGESTPMIEWFQLGGFAIFAPFSNFGGEGAVPVGSLPGLTTCGAYDMAGNVREWCWNETPKGRLVRGGAWNDASYMFGNLSQVPPFDRSSKNGFRCALYLDPAKIPDSVLAKVEFGEIKDFYQEKPVPDSIFQVYKEQFSYDPLDLNVRVESRDESSEDWIFERISFDAAYGNERMIVCLFLPRNATPPYQTIVYFPGAQASWRSSSTELDTCNEFRVFLSFIAKNGRAAVYPVYKGTMERKDDSPVRIQPGSHRHTDYTIQLVKDFKRCIDFLETRKDLDCDKLAYYGMSWGAHLGAIIPAVEDRLRTSILLGGGLKDRGRPEVYQLNYVTRVKIPTLMLNGRYDSSIPYETQIKPMFDFLGTPDEYKELKLFETDHIPPRTGFIRESLAWLDHYLGPVE